jgi:hypothetical protein
MFVNQPRCQCGRRFLSFILTGALPKSVQNTQSENCVFVAAEHSLNAAQSDDPPIFANDMPEWAGRHVNQAQVYRIPSINAVYSTEFLRFKVPCGKARCCDVRFFI